MEPKTYTSNDHHIHNALVDKNALFVLDRLHSAGYEAYLVGGGVRDLLMHHRPKDFDISTSARPEEIKKLFSRCILIGRRFRLAHVLFGKEIIEVSTFRAGDPIQVDLITRDNIWGNAEEDVLRRDFTINGLFYDPRNHEIIDYVGGFEDLKKHLLRTIGDPQVRFKQDPVRMIRMLKFRARFGFHIQEEALDALKNCRQDIVKSSPARVLEEILRMLESGSGERFFRLLVESEILPMLFPNLAPYFLKESKDLLYTYLRATDAMNQKAPLDRAVLTAALIFPLLDEKVATYYNEQQRYPHMGEIMEMSHSLIDDLIVKAFSHFPRRLRLLAHAINHMQYRLTPLDKKTPLRTRILRQREFPLALTFLKIRSLVHHPLFKSYQWWKNASRKGAME